MREVGELRDEGDEEIGELERKKKLRKKEERREARERERENEWNILMREQRECNKFFFFFFFLALSYSAHLKIDVHYS